PVPGSRFVGSVRWFMGSHGSSVPRSLVLGFRHNGEPANLGTEPRNREQGTGNGEPQSYRRVSDGRTFDPPRVGGRTRTGAPGRPEGYEDDAVPFQSGARRAAGRLRERRSRRTASRGGHTVRSSGGGRSVCNREVGRERDWRA